MRPWKVSAAVGVLAVAGLLGLGAPEADAGAPLVVKRFLLGHLEPLTGRFIALGGRGSEGISRDSVILFVFSAPLDARVGPCGAGLEGSVDARTIRIGVPTSPGLSVPAKGSFHLYRVSAFDSGSGQYVTRRTYRNRVLFDPLRRLDPYDPLRLGEPFAPETTYAVTLPGVDQGALKTVRSSKGAPLAVTFTTTFRTSDEEFSELFCPDMDGD